MDVIREHEAGSIPLTVEIFHAEIHRTHFPVRERSVRNVSATKSGVRGLLFLVQLDRRFARRRFGCRIGFGARFLHFHEKLFNDIKRGKAFRVRCKIRHNSVTQYGRRRSANIRTAHMEPTL